MGDEITTRDATKTFLRIADAAHTFQLRIFTFRVLELEDLHFNHDSAVLLPDFQNPPTDDGTPQPRITSLAILATCLKEAKANPSRKLLFCAHADTSGRAAYNVGLTEKRGDNTIAVLLGDEDKWVDVCKAQHKTRDIQMILTWIARDWGWSCDPGGVDDNYGPKTREGVKGFQHRFNAEYEGDLSESGTVDDKTWRAFFKLYQEELTEVADTDAAGLAELRGSLRWLNAGRSSVGCGESFPIDHPTRDSYRSTTNRRVEICFFEEGEEPLLDCHPAAGQCQPRRCEIYNPRMYAPQFIPVAPILPRVVRVRVHLELRWKDPTGTEHPFPKDMPIKLLYFGGTAVDQVVADGGKLNFIADRREQRFTLKYEQDPAQYIGSGPDHKEEILSESDADTKAKDSGYRIWKLPKTWTLGQTLWEVTNEFWIDPHFNLASNAIGTAAAPVKMVLDPTWQRVRFEYFDRHFGQSGHGNKRIAPPPLILEGMNEDPGDPDTERDQEADTRSNWTQDDSDREKMCQALPWLLQRNENGSANAAAKPDEAILLRLKTEPGTFVFSESAAVRRLDKPAPAALQPGPARLKYYDLPELWLSAGYWIRLPGTPGEGGKFWRDLTRAEVRRSLQAANALVVSLDDLVLSDGSGVNPLQPHQRPAVFFHSFDNTTPGASDYTLSRHGVYKPGNYDGTQQYYPYSDITLDPVRYYIRDYPNWVRLVVAQGNLYDVFSERTARDLMGTPAGARAARRWVDAVGTTVTPTNHLNPRPARTDRPSFSIQPFYKTETSFIRIRDTPAGKFEEWHNPFPGAPTWGNGRFDLALLRCCGVEGDRERAVNLHYFRFFFDYTTPPASLGTAAARASYTKAAVDNIVKRWNGPDGVFNPDPAMLRPHDPATHKLEVKPLWFVQELPLAEAHFRISVTAITRAFMQNSDGTAQYSADSHQPLTTPPNVGRFTAAHECGHADGLPDDYGEKWNDRACSYGLPSFAHNMTADAYSLISGNPAMMFQNKEVHPRYFWHAAEWVRDITGVPMQVEQGARRKFRLPQHPNAPGRHYVVWPIWREVGISGIGTNTRGRFDIYLYHLGDRSVGSDPYRDGLASGHSFDALAIILVKMRVTLPAAAQAADITTPMNRALRGIEDNFNHKFRCSGDVGPFHFDNCLIHFSPRFLIDTPTPDWDNYLKALDFAPPFPTTTPPFATAAARTAYFNNTVVPGYAAKVANIDSATGYPRHFMVTADNTGATSWTAGTSLHYRLPGNPADDYWQYFGDMLGLGLSSGGALTSARVSSLFVSRFMTHIGMANV